MKYKFFGIGLAVIAGVLIWQGSLMLFPKRAIVSEQRGEDEVSVEVNYLPGKSYRDKIVFNVSLDTHSVDLDGIDFKKSVILQKDGQTFIPMDVEISGSGHHRSAELSFSGVGVPLKIIFTGTQEVKRQEFGFEKLP